jgi:hypothetical protein
MRLSSLIEVVGKLKKQTVGIHMVQVQYTSLAGVQMLQLYMYCIIGKKRYVASDKIMI